MTNENPNYENANKYSTNDNWLNQPTLVAGIEVFPQKNLVTKINFKEESNLFKYNHQTGGLLCNHRYLIIKKLTIKPELQIKINELHDYYFDTSLCQSYISLSQYNEYNENIKKLLNVSCDRSFYDFEEAIYPIDYSKENLVKLTDDVLPERIADYFIIDNNDFYINFGWKWQLFILGENSD